MSACIIVSSNTSRENLQKILNFYDDESVLLAMNSVFPNYPIDSSKYACFNILSIMAQFRGKIVFGNHLDFNESSKLFVNGYHAKVLFLDKKDLLEIKEDIRNTEIFFYDKNQIRKAKNAELQPILR